MGTLTGNALNFAPKQTKIKQGIRFNEDGGLEIIMENKHDRYIQKRKFAGLGKGIGLDFTKDIIDNLGGKLEIYKEPIIKSGYDVSQKFGYKEITNEDEKIFDTFAVKIILPKSEISYEPQN